MKVDLDDGWYRYSKYSGDLYCAVIDGICVITTFSVYRENLPKSLEEIFSMAELLPADRQNIYSPDHPLLNRCYLYKPDCTDIRLYFPLGDKVMEIEAGTDDDFWADEFQVGE